MKFVFAKFKESQFRVLIKKSGSLCEMNKFMSSANKIDSRFEALFKSFMHRMKNNGPRNDPCGTPTVNVVGGGLDLSPSHSTNRVLSLN